MKNFLVVSLLFFSLSISAQNYKTHKIQEGETIESIAKHYLVTPFDLYALNPDAKEKFTVGTTLIIPTSKVKNAAIVEDAREVIDYKKHKVKRKETLYSLSKQYKVTEDDIKKANPSLYSEVLRKGDRIRIPRFKTIVSKQTLSNTTKKYTVLPKEGKWRVAYKFGITIPELEALNPQMNKVLQPGDELNVPNIANNEEKSTEVEYNYYEVLPKEGFYRLEKKMGLTEAQLKELNPELNDGGLKMGMILKIPKEIDVADSKNEDVATTDLSLQITNTNTKKLAVLLPFRLNRLDLDSIAEVKDIMKSDRILSTALDFHSGVLMALEDAKKKGISSNVDVFDTQSRTSKVSEIANSTNFSEYDAVIGPMMTKTFDRFASEVSGVPVFAPLSMPSKVSSNVYQTIPEKKLLAQKMIDFVKADSTKTKVIILADQKHKAPSNQLKVEFPGASQLFTDVSKKTGKDNYFIYPAHFENLFVNGRNIVFLETNNVGFGTTVISLLNGQQDEAKEIILVTTDRTKAFTSDGPDNNYHLSNLKFHYPTVNKQVNEYSDGFVSDYKERYGLTPSKYAVRGYDLTIDILLRLSLEENGLKDTELETEYIENKFRYMKKTFGGYVNQSTYIVKFEDLNLVEVKN